jgi:hypothetical protein
MHYDCGKICGTDYIGSSAHIRYFGVEIEKHCYFTDDAAGCVYSYIRTAATGNDFGRTFGDYEKLVAYRSFFTKKRAGLESLHFYIFANIADNPAGYEALALRVKSAWRRISRAIS